MGIGFWVLIKNEGDDVFMQYRLAKIARRF
jgi:hypothetical protein